MIQRRKETKNELSRDGTRSMESQTEGDLTDLGDLSVHGPGSVDVKKEIGKGKYSY